MDILPIELYDNIFKFLKDLDPISLYKLQFVSKNFYKIVNNLKCNYDKNYLKNNISLQNKINRLCFSNSLPAFKWLFKNNIFLTDNNIINVVSNNRLDILRECVKYNEILNTIFHDKYSILVFNSQKIVQTESPLIIAGIKGYYDIIKFLIEIPLLKNPFHQQLDILIEDCLSNLEMGKTIIKYICTYHYEKLIHKYFTTEKVLKKLDNCEDLIFYLMQSNKICINNNLILYCIERNYMEASIHAYKNIDENLLIPGEHIVRIFKSENTQLLDFFILNYLKHFNYVKKNLYKLEVSNKMFFHIFNNYLKYIDVDFPIIELYLQYEQNIDTLRMLINNNYLITKKSIIESLDFEDKNIFKILSEKYLKYNN